MSDLLDRFHRVLVQEIRKNRPEYLEARFTVAEIYQNLVPYRTHRDAIGVEMNGDYEDTLLRLLAGEGDYLLIESDVARREIREELKSSNPNTGLFRDFAAADVRLTSAHEKVEEEKADDGESAGELETSNLSDLIDLVEEASDDGSGFGDPPGSSASDDITAVGAVTAPHEDHDGLEDSDEPDRLEDAVAHEAVVEEDETSEGDHAVHDSDNEPIGEGDTVDESDDDVGEATASEQDSGESNSEACHWCRAALPQRSVLNYCPFCGSDLRLTPCAECGEELEPGWRFCPGCGTEADS
jgi:RNA polymerase subunit RPABC4/transcription elongation factor Spt4